MAKHVKGGKPAKQTRQAYETDDFGAPVLGVVFKDGRDLLRWIEQNREWERTAKVNTPAALLHRIDRGRRWRVSMFEPFGPIPGERRPTEEQMLDGWLHRATDDGLVIPLEAKRSIAALRSWAFGAAAEQATLDTMTPPPDTAPDREWLGWMIKTARRLSAHYAEDARRAALGAFTNPCRAGAKAIRTGIIIDVARESGAAPPHAPRHAKNMAVNKALLAERGAGEETIRPLYLAALRHFPEAAAAGRFDVVSWPDVLSADPEAAASGWAAIARLAEVELMKPTPKDAGPVAAGQERANTVIFSREGATWRVRWKGREGTVKDSLGVRYLARLVEFQGRKVSARDLRSYCSMKTADWAGKGCAEDLCCGDAGTRNGVRYDDGTVPDAAAQTEMWERYRAIKDSQDPAEIAEARDLLKHIRRFKPDAKAGDTNTVKAIDAKAADSIRNAIGRALKALAGEDSTDDSAMPELVKHLKRSTETGRVLCYKP
jgi:hypothetical protein